MDKKRQKKIPIKVGAAIADMRPRAGMTQEEVAERLGVGFEAISRMERGIVEPTVPRLIELAEIFSCPLQDFILPGSDRANDQAGHIERHISNLSSKDRDFVLASVANLASPPSPTSPRIWAFRSARRLHHQPLSRRSTPMRGMRSASSRMKL